MSQKPTPNSILISSDPLTGVNTWFDYEEDTDTTIISTTQDVESSLEKSKAMRNDPSKPWKGEDMHQVASIPLVVIEKWLREDGIDVFNRDHWDAVKRKLNSNEYQYLRTSPTTV